MGKLPPRTRVYLATAVYGLAGGGIAVAFHTGIHALYGHTIAAWSSLPAEAFAWRSLALMLGTSLLGGWLVHQRCPQAGGSGIPQLKLAFWKEFGWVSPKIMVIKFIAGILQIGGGMSLGREGPSVQLASTLGSALAAQLGVGKAKHRMPAAAGAAAGLAAAFNTPLAAVTFVLEEIIGDLNSRFLGSMLMASVFGALVAHGLLGAEPAFHMDATSEPGWVVYALTPLAAVLATLAGLLFQQATLRLRGWTRIQRTAPLWTLPAAGALLTWAVGLAVWHSTGRLGVFALGYEDLSAALSGHLAWQLAALLLVTKLAATVLCYGLGGCGGVFSPTLFLGGMAGLVTAGLGGLIFPLHGHDSVTLAVVGMCACLGAVVRAPVTGILILFEMTHQFSLVLPMMLAALVSQSLSRRLIQSSFYEAVLEQDGHHLTRIIPPRDLGTWQMLPASTIVNFHPIALADLSAESLRMALSQHPYGGFPLLEDGQVSGVLTRTAMERALSSQTAPVADPPVLITTQATIRTVQERIIDSSSGMLILCDDRQGLLGIVTLHDLLRAQLAYGQDLEQQMPVKIS